MDALGINIGYVVMHVIAIGLLTLILGTFLYTPMLRVLDERKERIAKGLEDARQAAIARDNADSEAKKILDAARAEAAKIRSDAAVQAEETASGILVKAREDSKAVVESASDDAEAERNRILSDLRGQVVDIAMAAANKIIGEGLSDKRQREIIDDFFSHVPDSVSRLSGDRAEVTTALPLTDNEQAAARQAIKASDINFRVDPSILGGVIVRVGDQVIDNSVAGKSGDMREALAA
jgi:F-type H+-transporting ATPase subunit b